MSHLLSQLYLLVPTPTPIEGWALHNAGFCTMLGPAQGLVLHKAGATSSIYSAEPS